MPENIHQNFSFLFENEIWKLVYEHEQNVLVIELRDIEDKQAFFQLIDLNTGILKGTQILSPSWMCNVVGITGDYIIVQKYKTGSFPEPKGWYLVNSKENKIELEAADGAIAFISGSKIYISKVLFEKIVTAAYDIETNKFIIAESLDTLSSEKAETYIVLPQQYSEDSVHLNTVKDFVQKKIKKEITGPCEYYEISSKIVVSYYIRAAEKLENFLLVSDEKGKILMDELINSNVQAFKKDTFFVIENQLIFIKEKKEIVSYVL